MLLGFSFLNSSNRRTKKARVKINETIRFFFACFQFSYKMYVKHSTAISHTAVAHLSNWAARAPTLSSALLSTCAFLYNAILRTSLIRQSHFDLSQLIASTRFFLLLHVRVCVCTFTSVPRYFWAGSFGFFFHITCSIDKCWWMRSRIDIDMARSSRNHLIHLHEVCWENDEKYTHTHIPEASIHTIFWFIITHTDRLERTCSSPHVCRLDSVSNII